MNSEGPWEDGMQLTDVHVRVLESGNSKLCGLASITLDGQLVIHDIKILRARDGLILAMPNRPRDSRCHSCGARTPLTACYCAQCGGRQPTSFELPGPEKTKSVYRDVAHPITRACRAMLEEQVFAAYRNEELRSSLRAGGSPAGSGEVRR
jgi:DNA-binding cell septation regulator SpoVG